MSSASAPTASRAARARTPTSVPGSDAARSGARGFTLIELMVVIAIIAIGAGAIALALRDGSGARLDQEAARLVALLEAARSEARASNLPVHWEVAGPGSDNEAQFRFVGLPPSNSLPVRFMTEGVRAEVVGARAVPLGPEPMIGPQRIVLALGERRVALATDGLGPFTVVESQ